MRVRSRFPVALALVAVAAGVPLPASPDPGGRGPTPSSGGRGPEAVAKLEEALLLDPQSAEIRRTLALALAAAAQEDLRTGRLDEARTRLERASDLLPGEAPLHILLGSLFFRRGDLYQARQATERGLAIAPGMPEGRELSGDLHYQEGALEQARRDWEAALAGGGPRAHGLRAKLDRLEREQAADASFGRDMSRHFTLQFEGPVPRDVARTALRLLEEAYGRLWREFGRPPQHDVPVILYSRGLFADVTRSPAWVAGSYDGKIRVPVGGLAGADDSERLGPLLAHELTHAFVRANVPGALPLWLEEGLAGHFQGMTGDEALRVLQARGARFVRLDDVSSALRGGTDVAGAYAAAALAVAEMVRADGFWLPRRTLEKVAAGVPFAAAFREVAGFDLAEFEERWARLQR